MGYLKETLHLSLEIIEKIKSEGILLEDGSGYGLHHLSSLLLHVIILEGDEVGELFSKLTICDLHHQLVDLSLRHLHL
jgi:hypothetical protein